MRIRRYQLERVQLELDRCTIVSPTDGIVISRNVDVGQTVAASLSAPILFEIAEDLSRMELVARVSEADIGRVRTGQRVEFVVDAYREKLFEGKVVQVRNASQVVDNVVTYSTIVQVDNSALLLKPGMTAEVRIITLEQPHGLRVRNTALRARLPERLIPSELPEAGGGRIVYLLPNDSPQLVPVRVETGISDGLYTEILSGLQEGDVLVVGMRLHNATSSSSRSSLFSGRQAQF